MNNFIKKLSQREIGFIFLFLFVIIGYFYKMIPVSISVKFLFTVTPVVMIIRLWLLVSGLIKIFSKKSINITNEQEIVKVNNTKLAESITWITLGVLGTISFFLFMFLCEFFLKEAGACAILGIYSIFVLIPVTIVGVICIIIGLVKLSKYFKYKKIQQQNIIYSKEE